MLMLELATKRQFLTGGLIVIFAAIALFVILPQFSTFAASIQSIMSANLPLVALAVALSLLPPFLSSLIYGLLSSKPLKLSATFVVQLSGLFVNRVLPAGIGGIGLNVWYLRRKRHAITDAGTIVGLNSVLGIAGNLTLLAIAMLVFSSDAVRDVGAPSISSAAPLTAMLVLLTIGAVSYKYQTKIVNILIRVRLSVVLSFRRYRRKPTLLPTAFLLSCLLTLSNAASFWVCCLALNLGVSYAAAFLIVSIGVAAGTAIPTPGGLGGVETALVAGLLTQGVDPSLGLAGALLYRLSSYWIGLFVGLCALVVLSRHIRLKTL
jgi:uncharacterized protein (TIRG00374 family)